MPIDLFAHSQGGLVVRLALIELERRHGAEWLARIGLVATLGTPHGGADLATAIHALSSTRSGATVLDVVAAATGQELDHDGAVGGAAERDLEPRRGAGRSPGARRHRCRSPSPPEAT